VASLGAVLRPRPAARALLALALAGRRPAARSAPPRLSPPPPATGPRSRPSLPSALPPAPASPRSLVPGLSRLFLRLSFSPRNLLWGERGATGKRIKRHTHRTGGQGDGTGDGRRRPIKGDRRTSAARSDALGERDLQDAEDLTTERFPSREFGPRSWIASLVLGLCNPSRHLPRVD